MWTKFRPSQMLLLLNQLQELFKHHIFLHVEKKVKKKAFKAKTAILADSADLTYRNHLLAWAWDWVWAWVWARSSLKASVLVSLKGGSELL